LWLGNVRHRRKTPNPKKEIGQKSQFGMFPSKERDGEDKRERKRVH